MQNETSFLLPIRFRNWLSIMLFLVLGFSLASPVLAQKSTPADQLHSLAQAAKEGIEAAEQNNLALMQAEYQEIHETWERFENELREQNPTAYIEVEGALEAIDVALQTKPLDSETVRLAYTHLLDEATEIAEEFDGEAPTTAVSTIETTPAGLLKSLDVAYHEIEEGEIAEAAEQLTYVIRAWPSVEGAIATKSPEAYTAIEIDLSRAMAALQDPADLGAAEAAVKRLRESLSPFVLGQGYTMFDAAAIILREGLEALLVIVALLAFLNRSGNRDKRRWIWAGGALGVLASLITAFALQVMFNYASTGQNREVIEGVTGLIAAGLLFYVSYWLHSKASLHAWQKYINVRTTQALANGSMTGLALLAFLAVFREGAETTIFYLGMAPSISVNNLWLGIGLGLGILAVVAVLMLKLGLKLPLRLFFRIAGLLVYYLGFKFLGTGIHALQIGGLLPASPIDALSAIPFIGFYPTWETVGLQSLLLVGALIVLLYLYLKDRRFQAATIRVTT